MNAPAVAMDSRLTQGRRGWIAATLIAAIVLAIGWPGLAGDWGRDDYFQLALARMLGSPWPLFTSDHYPVPGSVFRPLGFASMWLDTRLFGTDYAAHALVDLVLHAGVALALFGVLCKARIPTLLAALAGLAFALHPAAASTAQWWSARFDVLATLFVLLTLQAAFAYRLHPRTRLLLLALLAAFAAMTSKEIGLLAPAALMLVWARWAWCDRASRALALRACAAAFACAFVFLIWRMAVLGTASSHLLGDASPLSALLAGVTVWLRDAGGYLSWAARLLPWQRAVLACTMFAGLALLALELRARWRERSRRTAPAAHVVGAADPRIDLVVCGLLLLLVPALLQAPVARLNAQSLSAAYSAVEAAMQARLYYLGSAGIALVLGAALASMRPQRQWFAAGIVTIVLIVFGSASWQASRAFAQRSAQIASMAHAAVAAVEALPRSDAQCRIVFVGVEEAREWGGFVAMDSIVKALAKDRSQIAHCWIHADAPTYFHLQDAAAMPADAAPWMPLAVDGKPLPWPRVGALRYAYLSAPTQLDAHTLATTQFLRWQDGRFVDVSTQVIAGRIKVQPWSMPTP